MPTPISPVEIFLNLEMSFPMNFFLMICTFVIYYNKFSLVVQETTLGNSRIFTNAKHVKKKPKCGIREYLYVRVQ